jgi:hypothetical protein
MGTSGSAAILLTRLNSMVVAMATASNTFYKRA